MNAEILDPGEKGQDNRKGSRGVSEVTWATPYFHPGLSLMIHILKVGMIKSKLRYMELTSW